jgi:hypothetical protein
MAALRWSRFAILSFKPSPRGSVMYGASSTRSFSMCSGCCARWKRVAESVVAVVSLVTVSHGPSDSSHVLLAAKT